MKHKLKKNNNKYVDIVDVIFVLTVFQCEKTLGQFCNITFSGFFRSPYKQ